MVLAHLRGLLKPDYAQGIRSKIREEIVLRAILREYDAEAFLALSQFEASALPAAGERYRGELYNASRHQLLQATQMARLMTKTQIERVLPPLHKARDIQHLSKVFNLLKQTSVFTTLASAVE